MAVLGAAFMNFASLVASACLLGWMRRVHGHHAKKLLTRQLWHLAVADLCEFMPASVGSIHTILIQFFGLGAAGSPSTTLSVVCNGYFAANIGCMVSVLIELHLALTCLSVVFRWQTMVGCLSRSLAVAWPVGAIVGSLVVGLDEVYWDAELSFCNTGRLTGESLKSLVLTVALLLCLLLYALALIWRQTHSGTPSRGVWDRARYFVLAAILSWTPFVAYQFFVINNALISSTTVTAVTFVLTCLNMNGLLNAWVYAHQSRLVRRIIRDAELRAGRNKVSFCVDFKADADVILCAPSSEVAAREQPDMDVESSFQVARWKSDLQNDLLFGAF